VQGWSFRVGGASQVGTDGKTYDLTAWSDGGAAPSHMLLTPDTDASFTATFSARPDPTATATQAPATATATATSTSLPPTATATQAPATATATAIATATTPSGDGQQLTLSPVADTYGSSGSPSTVHGSYNQMESDGSPAREAFLRFDTRSVGGMVTAAKLRLYVLGGANTAQGSLHRVADTGWSETALTWDTRPAMDAAPLATYDTVPTGAWLELDVTEALDDGPGLYSFGLRQGYWDGIEVAAREHRDATLRPRLVITTR
jgi:hypothetical protein